MHQITVSNYVRDKLIELQEEIDESTILLDISTPSIQNEHTWQAESQWDLTFIIQNIQRTLNNNRKTSNLTKK